MAADAVVEEHSAGEVLHPEAVVVELVDAGIGGELEGDLYGVLLAHRVDHHAPLGTSRHRHQDRAGREDKSEQKKGSHLNFIEINSSFKVSI